MLPPVIVQTLATLGGCEGTRPRKECGVGSGASPCARKQEAVGAVTFHAQFGIRQTQQPVRCCNPALPFHFGAPCALQLKRATSQQDVLFVRSNLHLRLRLRCRCTVRCRVGRLGLHHYRVDRAARVVAAAAGALQPAVRRQQHLHADGHLIC